MPGKPPARRTRAGVRRTGRRGSRDDDVTPRDSIGFNSNKAFIAVTLLGLLGFLTVLCQLYRAVNSERGLEVGGFRLHLRTQLPSIPAGPMIDAANIAATGLPSSFLPPAEVHAAVQEKQESAFTAASTTISLQRWQDAPATKGAKYSTATGAGDIPPVKPYTGEGLVVDPGKLQTRARTLLSEGRTSGSGSDRPAGIQASHEPTLLPHCKWRQYNGQYLGEFAATAVEEGEREAKETCAKLGTSVCRGVTCSASRLVCSARHGVPYLAASPENEVSFTLECEEGANPQVTNPQLPDVDDIQSVEPDLPTVAPDFTVPEVDYSVFRLKPPGRRQPLGAGRAALVVIAHNRVDCLTTCLRTIVSQDGVDTFKLVVSLDDKESSAKMIDALAEFRVRRDIDVWLKPVEYLKTAVQKIAAHFRFAISQAFDHNKFEFAIFLENDLTLAPDALWYFRSAAWLLEEDPSLFCVSAWNDNGIRGLASDERRIFRTDYFPGLGWMIQNSTWSKIKGIWPKNPTTGWDHWLRHGSGLRPRECVVPEVSRTHHFDTKGTNVKAGNAIAKLLEKMVTSSLPPGQLRITPDLLKDEYEQRIKTMLANAETTSQSGLDFTIPNKTYILPYAREEYKFIAKKLEIYGAQPRTAHRGMVITRHPKSHATVVLLDRRQDIGVLSEADLWKPHPKRRIGAAQKGQSCDLFCRSHHMRCDPRELEFINRCSVLKRYFPCENGCGHQVGFEIPCYVHDRSAETASQCLVTDEATPTCQAGHKSTTRVCACVP